VYLKTCKYNGAYKRKDMKEQTDRIDVVSFGAAHNNNLIQLNHECTDEGEDVIERHFISQRFPVQIEEPWSENDDFFIEIMRRESIVTSKPSIEEDRESYEKLEELLDDDIACYEEMSDQHLACVERKQISRRKYLANLILRCEELTNSEKSDAYCFLTGDSSPDLKLGAPSRLNRDVIMAMEYMLRVYKGSDPIIVKSKLMVDTVYNAHIPNTFNTALNKGKRHIKSAVDEYQFYAGLDSNEVLNKADMTFVAKTLFMNLGVDQIVRLVTRFIE